MGNLIIYKNKRNLLINSNKQGILIKPVSTTTLSKIFIGSASDDTRYSLDGGETWSQMDYS